MKIISTFLAVLLICSQAFSQKEVASTYNIPLKELNDYMRTRFFIVEDNPKLEKDVLRLQIAINMEGRVSHVQFLEDFEYQDSQQILEYLKLIKEKEIKSRNTELILEIEVLMPKIAGYAGVFKLTTSVKRALTKMNRVSDEVVKIDYSPVLIDLQLLQKYEYSFGGGLARESLPYFNENIEAKLQPKVLVLLIDKSTMNGEYAWLEVVSESNGSYDTKISTPPKYIKGFNVGQHLIVNREDVMDWVLTDKKKTIGNFTHLPARNATLSDYSKKLEPYINTFKLVKISKKADEAILTDPELDVDIKANFARHDTTLQKFLIANQVINVTLNRQGYFYRKVVENDMYKLIEQIRYAYNLDEEGSPLKDLIVSFHVMKDGGVVNPRIVSGGNLQINPDVIRCLNNMEKWEPALKNKQPVNSVVVLNLGTMEML